ncbi:MAG: beta-lactamase family protein [Clostridiales bacterium]|nr:beta-lactamase family protein [Clostridiales bacterium]
MRRDLFEKSKKLVIGLLALAVVLSCACGKKDETTEKTENGQSEETEDISSEELSSEENSGKESASSEKEKEPEDTSASAVSDTDDTASSDPTTAPVVSSFDTGEAEEYLSSKTFDGVVLVADQDQVVWTYAAGMADRENNVMNTMNTVFEFGSITKQFTAVAIMQLVEAGKLKTDDTLDKYLPEYSHAKEITIHQLLNMTSGIPDYLYCGVLGVSLGNFEDMSFSDVLDLEDAIRRVITTPIDKNKFVTDMSAYSLNFTPGTQFEYSNTNYYFLGMVIEQLSGMPYDEYIRKNLLEPLGITELYPDTDHLTSFGRTDLSVMKFDFPSQDPSISYAVGVMTGTAAGLLDWEIAVMDGALLTKESWDQIFDGGAFGYGYGWYIGNGFVEHGGMTLGYNTSVRVDKNKRRVVIVLSNIQPLTGSKKRPMSTDIADELWTDF